MGLGWKLSLPPIPTSLSSSSSTTTSVGIATNLDGWLPRHNQICGQSTPFEPFLGAGSTGCLESGRKPWDLPDIWTPPSASSSSTASNSGSHNTDSTGNTRAKRKEMETTTTSITDNDNGERIKIARSVSSSTTSTTPLSSSTSSSSTAVLSKHQQPEQKQMVDCVVGSSGYYWLFDNHINRFRWLKFVRRPVVCPSSARRESKIKLTSSSSSSLGDVKNQSGTESSPFEAWTLPNEAYGYTNSELQSIITGDDSTPMNQRRSFVLINGGLYEFRWRVISADDDKTAGDPIVQQPNYLQVQPEASEEQPRGIGHLMGSSEYLHANGGGAAGGGRLVLEVIRHMIWCNSIASCTSIMAPNGDQGIWLTHNTGHDQITGQLIAPPIPGRAHTLGIYWLAPPTYSSNSTSIVPDANASPLTLPSTAMFVGHFYGRYTPIYQEDLLANSPIEPSKDRYGFHSFFRLASYRYS
jgi:hypothetical protein